jgi:hypothetical protein
MTVAGYPTLPQGADLRRVVETVQMVMRGKFNAVTTLTLAAGVTTTVFIDERIGGESFIGLTPLSANAAAAVPTTWVSARDKGQATITHANTASVDRAYSVLIIG